MTDRARATGRPLELCVVGDALLDVDWNGTVDRVSGRTGPVLETPAERARPGGAALAAVLAAASAPG